MQSLRCRQAEIQVKIESGRNLRHLSAIAILIVGNSSTPITEGIKMTEDQVLLTEEISSVVDRTNIIQRRAKLNDRSLRAYR